MTTSASRKDGKHQARTCGRAQTPDAPSLGRRRLHRLGRLGCRLGRPRVGQLPIADGVLAGQLADRGDRQLLAPRPGGAFERERSPPRAPERRLNGVPATLERIPSGAREEPERSPSGAREAPEIRRPGLRAAGAARVVQEVARSRICPTRTHSLHCNVILCSCDRATAGSKTICSPMPRRARQRPVSPRHRGRAPKL